MTLHDLLKDIQPGESIRREAWPSGMVITCRGRAGLLYDRDADYWTLHAYPVFEAPPEEELANCNFDVHADDWVQWHVVRRT